MSIKILRKFLSLNILGSDGVQLAIGSYTDSVLFDNMLFLSSSDVAMHNLLFFNRSTFDLMINNSACINITNKDDFIHENDTKLILEYGRKITDENLLLEYNLGLPEIYQLKISDFDDFLNL